MRSRNINSNKNDKSLFNSAYTVIELIVVVAIIAILAAIIIVSYSSWRQTTTVAQLKSDLSNVASAMENYRTFNNAYPTSVPSTFTPSSGNTLTGGSSDGGLTYCVSGVNSQFTNLYYHIDSTNSGTGATSGICPSVVQYTLTLVAGTGGTVSGGGTYTAGQTPTMAAITNTYYSFVSWTGDLGCSGSASHTITINNSNLNCTANFAPTDIATPSAPTVVANTVGATTTFSWGATDCSGNTARYQYDYTVNPIGSDSGWVATASTSAAFTTSTEGQTYTLAVQAQCYNAVNSSSWSASGSANYYRSGTYLQISAGDNYVCSIAGNNLAYCWGINSSGSVGGGLGVNSLTNYSVPTAVYTGGALNGLTMKAISAFNLHTCGIASNDLAYCWGYNVQYQVGTGSSSNAEVAPVAVNTSGVLSGKTIKAISAGFYHSCVIASDNNAYCWGSNTYGGLGNNNVYSQYPVAVTTSGVLSGKTIKYISSGQEFTCAIASDNLAYCWGIGLNGQLGNNTTSNSGVPVAVNTSGVLNGKTIKAISANYYHTCVIASDNLAYCWGRDAEGQLGNNLTSQSNVPVAVNTSGVLNGKTIKSISTGFYDTCAIASDDQLYCWGYNFYGELGNNSNVQSNVPVAVNTSGVLNGKTIKSVTVADRFTCAIASDNQSYCWGLGGYRFGDGNLHSPTSYVPVATNAPY